MGFAPPDITFSKFYPKRSVYRVAALGDSQTAGNHRVLANSYYGLTTSGYLVWLDALLGGRMQWTHLDNYGVAGNTSVQARARVPAIIASDVGTCFYHIGTNDAYNIVNNYITLNDTISAIEGTIDSLLRAGIKVILIPPMQRTTAVWTTTFSFNASQILQVRQLTARIRAEMLRISRMYKDVFFADPTAAFTDGITGGPRDNYTYDGTHYKDLGAFAIAKAIAPIVSLVIPPMPCGVVDPADVWSTINPKGNLLNLPLFNGTPVMVTTPIPLSGQLPSGWGVVTSNLGNITGGTVVFSIVSRSDGLGNAVRLQCSGLVGNQVSASIGLGQNVTIDNTRLSSEDILQGSVNIDVAAGWVGLRGVQARFLENDGSGVLLDAAAPHLAYSNWPIEAMIGYRWNTTSFPIRPQGGAGSRIITSRLQVNIDTTIPGGASCDVIFWAPTLRKV